MRDEGSDPKFRVYTHGGRERTERDAVEWARTVAGLGAGELYKFEIRNRHTGAICLKSDPCARAAELRPATASVIVPTSTFEWHDRDWIEQRAERDWLHAPMSVYDENAQPPWDLFARPADTLASTRAEAILGWQRGA